MAKTAMNKPKKIISKDANLTISTPEIRSFARSLALPLNSERILSSSTISSSSKRSSLSQTVYPGFKQGPEMFGKNRPRFIQVFRLAMYSKSSDPQEVSEKCLRRAGFNRT